IAYGAWKRRTDQAAHGNDSDFVERGSRPSLQQNFAETRNRFCFANAAKALKRSEHQHEVHEETGAQRHKQKNTKTTQSAICCHFRTKLPENHRAHKRFSRGGTSHRRFWCCSVRCPQRMICTFFL